MSYPNNPYMAVKDESLFNASGTTLVDDKRSHYRDDSQPKVQFNEYSNPQAIQNAEDAPLVRQDLGIFIARLPFNN